MNFSQTYAEALDKITKNCFKNKNAFVIYKKADDNTLNFIFSSKYQRCFLQEIKANSFVFMPFQVELHGYAIEMTNKIQDSGILELAVRLDDSVGHPFNSFTTHNEMKEEDFLTYVDNIKKEIGRGEISKLVASRVSSKRFKGNIISAFLSLCDLYTHSFNYLVYIPGEQCWIGATPELLLQLQGHELRTISLAGTQVKNASDEYSWGKKELEEQKIVTSYIVESLKNQMLTDVVSSAPYTIKAANLVHLRSDISGRINGELSIKKIIQNLHPTPAVCGSPKTASYRYIIKNEPYDRSFYTGYLGEFTNENAMELYVNLRCASIDKNNIHFYVGCGITRESVAEKEWVETENKLNTLRNVFGMPQYQ